MSGGPWCLLFKDLNVANRLGHSTSPEGPNGQIVLQAVKPAVLQAAYLKAALAPNSGHFSECQSPDPRYLRTLSVR